MRDIALSILALLAKARLDGARRAIAGKGVGLESISEASL
jgi:hypothetical protein